MRRRLTAAEVWRWPLALGAVSALGLGTALVSDSVGDLIAWLALSVPVAVSVWYGARRTSG
ncbi:MAG TPA: hypothetical protein VF210_13070 [Pseudomonadales bacterium]